MKKLFDDDLKADAKDLLKRMIAPACAAAFTAASAVGFTWGSARTGLLFAFAAMAFPVWHALVQQDEDKTIRDINKKFDDQKIENLQKEIDRLKLLLTEDNHEIEALYRYKKTATETMSDLSEELKILRTKYNSLQKQVRKPALN